MTTLEKTIRSAIDACLFNLAGNPRQVSLRSVDPARRWRLEPVLDSAWIAKVTGYGRRVP